MQTITINGIQYGMGLWWQAIDPMSYKQAKTKARQTIEEMNQSEAHVPYFVPYNCYAIKDNHAGNVNYSMVGLGCFTNGERAAKIESLAMSLLLADPDRKWIGKFLFGDEAWIVAIADGMILPDEGADYYGPYNEAQEIFERLIADNDEGSGYEILEYDSIDESRNALESILSRLPSSIHKRTLIHPLKQPFPVKHVVISVAVVCVGAGMFWGYKVFQNYQYQKMLENQRLIAQQKLLLQRKQLNQESSFSNVWEQKPSPDVFLTTAWGLARNQAISSKGWQVESIAIDEKTIVFGWHRKKYAAFSDFPDNAVFDFKKPDICATTTGLNIALPARSEKSPLLTKDKGAAGIYDVAKLFACSVDLEWKGVPQKMVNVGEMSKKNFASFGIYSFQFRNISSFPSTERLQAFASLAGVVVNGLKYTKEGNWEIIGDIYVKS